MVDSIESMVMQNDGLRVFGAVKCNSALICIDCAGWFRMVLIPNYPQQGSDIKPVSELNGAKHNPNSQWAPYPRR